MTKYELTTQDQVAINEQLTEYVAQVKDIATSFNVNENPAEVFYGTEGYRSRYEAKLDGDSIVFTTKVLYDGGNKRFKSIHIETLTFPIVKDGDEINLTATLEQIERYIAEPVGLAQAVADFNSWIGAATVYYDESDNTVWTNVYASENEWDEYDSDSIFGVLGKHKLEDNWNKTTAKDIKVAIKMEQQERKELKDFNDWLVANPDKW